MRERDDRRRDDGGVALVEDLPLTCQVCGAVQESSGNVLCAACGEPVHEDQRVPHVLKHRHGSLQAADSSGSRRKWIRCFPSNNDVVRHDS